MLQKGAMSSHDFLRHFLVPLRSRNIVSVLNTLKIPETELNEVNQNRQTVSG